MTTVFTLAGAFGLPQNVPPQLRGDITRGNTVTPIYYNNLGLSNANSLDGAQKIDAAAHAVPGPKVFFGHSLGAIAIARWLHDYGPTSDIPPEDLSFVCIGSAARRYGGFIHSSVVGTTADIMGRLWSALTPSLHLVPVDTPYTVTDVARQYDGYADWPAGNGPTAIANAVLGMGNIHAHYELVNLQNPRNATFVEGNITYIWAPTYPLPTLEWMVFHPVEQQKQDRTQRAIVEASYDRPVAIPRPLYDNADSPPHQMLSAEEFAHIEMRLRAKSWAYQNKPIPQPEILLLDKNMERKAKITIPESWDCEEIAHDDGSAHIEIVGKDNEWLRDLIIHKTRPAEDLHIIINPDPDKPHDYKNRWGGKVETIRDIQERGKPTVTVLNVISNRRHLAKFNLAATPLLPPAIQPVKMFLWGGPCASTCATAMQINLDRVYSLNAFWPIPRNVLAPETWLENISRLNHPVQVMPINVLLDQSRWCTIAARWKDAKTVLTPVMKDCGVICHAYTWMPGDPAPYSEVFGEALGEILKPTRACVILSFENDSGVTGPTGTAVDGLINLFAATADDLITELLYPVDGDGDGETDPLIRKLFGVAPKRPAYVYRDVGYGGPHRREMTIHKSQAVIIVTGGRSPAWVNMAITFAIRYSLSQLAQVINYGLGAYQQYGTEGLDNLYQGQADDTVLAFMNFIDPIRSAEVGPYAFQEHFEVGTGTAFTVNSIFTIREGWWKTRPYVSFKFDVDAMSPFVFGEDIRLGSRVIAEERNIEYTDQVLAYKRQGSRTGSHRPVLSFGDDSREEDPFAQGIATVANVANFAALLAGSGEMF